jgi:putative FmdB family regulatory protein
MVLMDFHCGGCDTVFEEMAPIFTKVFDCPVCGGASTRVFMKAAKVCTEIIPTYPGCKKQKAGYVHTSHADHDATRVQSGYKGCQAPK